MFLNLVIINLKINNFWIINQQPKFCAILFSNINPDTHFGTKKNTVTFYTNDLGDNSPQKPKKCKKMGGYTFFMPGTKIYPVMMSIQIHARGSGFFFIKMVQYAHSERSQKRYYQRKNQQFQRLFRHNSKNYLPDQSSIPIDYVKISKGGGGLPPRSRRIF